MIKPLNVPYRSDAIVKVVKETEEAKVTPISLI